MAERPAWTAEQIRALGAATDLTTAASVLGISRSQAYRLAAADRFPTPVVRVGTRVIGPVAGLLRLLLVDDPDPTTVPAARLDPCADRSVDATTNPADSPPRRRRTDHHDGEPW